MSSFERLKTIRKDRECFLKLRFFSEMYKNEGVLKDTIITDQETGESIKTTDKIIINQIVTEKYN